ncbi:hypothetical Protein YC6258_01411 [Gynuella sunshinyii YC6258]|uniref:Uncharacterized protein n=1 Tax=Gynuella sunshinyii YC6258 TaxID=1445510 RepID=A0A0C5VT11_9GAMM|nr:hypothetical Protein YC6258_01411 [Gynuella sunshinyii YC6258]
MNEQEYIFENSTRLLQKIPTLCFYTKEYSVDVSEKARVMHSYASNPTPIIHNQSPLAGF